LWDLIVSKIEDTISESFRGQRQLPYAHWITLLILCARPVPLPAHLQRELTDSDTVFPHYDPRQMLRAHHDLRATPPPRAPCGPVPPPSPRGTRSTGVVSETEEQQDIAIGVFVDAEVEGEFDFASDSSDDDWRPPVSDLPPRAHDHEAGGSSSASELALLAILEGMMADQRRAAEEQAKRDRDQATINATVQARQDELQRQFLTFQEQQLAFEAQQTAMMAASGIQIPQIQLPGTSTVRPPTLAPETQSQSQQPLQLPAQSQPFSTPQHQVSQGAISSGYEQVPQFTPFRSGFTPQSAIASQLVLDSSTDPHLSFTYSALTGDPTPPSLQAPAAFTAPVTTTERLSSSVASSEQLAPSSTMPETSATATESVPASSAGLEQPT